MQAFLKKNFWVVNLAAAMICAVFAARATVHLLEAKYLSEDPSPSKARPTVRRAKKATAALRSKEGQPLVDRNMFCSSCLPPEPEVDAPIADSDTPPPTSLPLRLIATNVARDDSASFATIHHTSSHVVGAYHVGDEIPDAGPVVRIRGKYVDFQNKSSKRVERLAFSDEPAPRTASSPPPVRPRRGRTDELTAALDEGIKKIDDTHYEISRDLVNKIIANPAAIRGARIVPSIKNGKPNGFKLYAIRPSSAFAKIGLQNGDTIHSINGFDLTSPDKALEVYTKVREANSLSVSITRRGRSITMDYNIR